MFVRVPGSDEILVRGRNQTDVSPAYVEPEAIRRVHVDGNAREDLGDYWVPPERFIGTTIEASARQRTRADQEPGARCSFVPLMQGLLRRFLHLVIRYTPQCPCSEAPAAAYAELLQSPNLWDEPGSTYRCTSCHYIWVEPNLIGTRS